MTDSNLVDGVLALTRQALTPPPDLRERVQARLQGQAPLALRAAEAGPQPFLRLSKRMTLAASGTLLALGFVAGQALRPAASAETPPALPRVVETPGGASAAPGWAHPEPLPEAAAPAPEPQRGRPPKTAREAPLRKLQPQPDDTPTAADGSRAELALLQRAERAVRAANSALALSLTAELGERFPRSQLLEERHAIELMAHCAAHAVDSRRRAERFLRDHARSVYAERVTALCLAEPATNAEPADKSRLPGHSSAEGVLP